MKIITGHFILILKLYPARSVRYGPSKRRPGRSNEGTAARGHFAGASSSDPANLVELTRFIIAKSYFKVRHTFRKRRRGEIKWFRDEAWQVNSRDWRRTCQLLYEVRSESNTVSLPEWLELRSIDSISQRKDYGWRNVTPRENKRRRRREISSRVRQNHPGIGF